MSKIIQSGGCLGSLVAKLAGPLIKVAAPLAKNVLAPLATRALAFVTDNAIQRKMHGRGAVRAGKGIALVILDQDLVEIIRIIKSLVKLEIWIDGVSKTVSQKTKRWEGGFFGVVLKNLGVSILRKMLTGKRVMRAVKGFAEAGTVIISFMWVKSFISALSIDIGITKYFNYKPWFNDDFLRDDSPRIKDGAYIKNLGEEKYTYGWYKQEHIWNIVETKVTMEYYPWMKNM